MEHYDPHHVLRLAVLVEEDFAPQMAWGVRQQVFFPCSHLIYPIDFYAERPDKLWVAAPVAIFTLLYPPGQNYELDVQWFEGVYLLGRERWPGRHFTLDVIKPMPSDRKTAAYRGQLKDLIGLMVDRANWLYDRRRTGKPNDNELEQMVRQALQL